MKRGYSRATHLTSNDIRNGRLDRVIAEAIVEEYEGARPASLDIFLEYIGLSEEEFNEIALSHKLFDFDSPRIYKIGKRPSDFENLTRHPGMPVETKDRILDKWREQKN